MRFLVPMILLVVAGSPLAQIAPSASERAAYRDLFAAAASGDVATIERLSTARANLFARDDHGRTPLHVAAFLRQRDAMRALVKAGADPNALEHDRYDIVTIAAVADDVPTLEAALALGGNARNVTSRYDGTALIAAAHLGHAEVVRQLIRRRRSARPREQPGMDGADRIDRARRRRCRSPGDAARARSTPAPTSTWPTAAARLRWRSRDRAITGR